MNNSALSLALNLPPFTAGINYPTPDFWLDASDSSTITQATGVSNWVDKIAGINTSQADGSKQPLLITNAINELPTIRFDGTNDFLRTSDMTATWGTGDKTLCFIAKYTATAREGLFDSAPNAPATIRNYNYFTNGQLDWHDAKPALTIDASLNVFAIYFFEYWFNSVRNIAKYINGGNYATATSANNSDLRWTTFTLGIINGNERPFQGDISEVLCYKRKLTTEERTGLFSYLSGKWGIALV